MDSVTGKVGMIYTPMSFISTEGDADYAGFMEHPAGTTAHEILKTAANAAIEKFPEAFPEVEDEGDDSMRSIGYVIFSDEFNDILTTLDAQLHIVGLGDAVSIRLEDEVSELE